MLGIDNLPIDLEARLHARWERQKAEEKAQQQRANSSSYKPIEVPGPIENKDDESKRAEGKLNNENQQPVQNISREMLIKTNRQVLPDLKVVIATLERDLQADRSPLSNQRTPEIIGDAEPEWIKLLEDILGQLNAIRAVLEQDISADVTKQKPEAIFSTRRFLIKMVDGSAIAIGSAATVLTANIIAHTLDELTGTTFARDLINQYK